MLGKADENSDVVLSRVTRDSDVCFTVVKCDQVVNNVDEADKVN